MKVVYIAGPYGDKGGYLAIDRNIAKAREAAAALANAGVGFFCPHLNSAHFEAIVPGVSNLWWRELDLKLLAACDAIFMLKGWSFSEGAKLELADALARGLPAFYDIDGEGGDGEWLNLLNWASEEAT